MNRAKWQSPLRIYEVSVMKIFKLSVFYVFLIFTMSAFGQKLTVEEIIAKQLDSIGTKEKRAEIKNMMILGTAGSNVLRSATFNFSNISGYAVFLSETNKIYYGMKFDFINYPFDEIVYDNKSVDTAYIKPGQRSALGYYIVNNRDIVKEGLLGGSLSTSWSLLDLSAHNASVGSDGKKKIDGKETYVLNYSFKGTSPLSIKLYFNAENFQHVRTEYTRSFPAPFTGVANESSFQTQTIHKLTENFTGYKTANGITLPHSYRINLLLDGKVTDEIEWRFEFSEFRFNQKIDPTSFNVK
jgi:outer membrane lipoprotein-sorting protein